ncbi:Hypp4764 [Branchiostoma lanceolatum]|uniref:Hypp4764 protein n=1 Tax=Branchiostoma lanceolatum TaxID=7740 RepID=A0A8K0A9Z3_BRALA|nr:Hypp4764 [Branchiostoma lanceolatum]
MRWIAALRVKDTDSPQGQQSTLGNKIRSGVGKGVEAIQRKITLSKSQSSLGKLHVRRKSSDEGSDGTQKPQVEKVGQDKSKENIPYGSDSTQEVLNIHLY